MILVNSQLIVAFIDQHSDSRSSLLMWRGEVIRHNYANPNQLRESFPSASFVGKWTVFNISGRKYRMITEILYDRGEIVIDQILTHAGYDLIKLKR